MVGDCLSAEVTDVILIRVLMVGNHFATEVTDVILIRIRMVGDYISANVAYVVFILIDAIIRFDAFRTAVCRALAGVCAVTV